MPILSACLHFEIIEGTHTQKMALVKPLFLASSYTFALPVQTVSKRRHFNIGYRYKFPGMEISNAKPNPVVNYNKKFFATDYVFKSKGISVATDDTSLTKTTELLNAYEDEYDGIIIDPECLPSGANAFVAILNACHPGSYWKLKGKKGIWLKIIEQQADLVPIAIQEGFSYHHAEPGYVMLTCWIPDEPCMLPATATHQVGVGAFVVNESREVLVVKEKKCPLTCFGIWKIPTGLINKSEEIFSGAVREVQEETGVDTTFLDVIAFRHAHNVTFEMSDLFFVCMLKPLSLDISIDESEIQAAKWMPLDEFLDQPFHRNDIMLNSMLDICVARYENRYQGFTACQMMSKFDDRLSHLYFSDLNKSTRNYL